MVKLQQYLNLEYGMYAILVSLPVYLIRLNGLGLPTNVLELLLVAMGLIWLARKRGQVDIFANYRKHRDALLPILLIGGGFLLSTLWNENYSVDLGIIKGWLLFPLGYIFLVGEATSFRNKKLFYSLYLSTFLVAILALVAWSTGRVTYDGRLQGIFNSPNYLAMYLAPGLIIGLWEIISYRQEKVNYGAKLKIGWAVSVMVIAAGVYLTYSYAAWIAIALALLGGLLVSRRMNWKYGVLGVALLLLVVFLQAGTEKFQALVTFDERSSGSSRAMVWRSATQILRDNWFWGIGPGNFQAKYLEYQQYYPPYLEWAVPHPHNLYLAFWLSGGMVGFLGFVWLGWNVFRAGIVLSSDKTSYLMPLIIVLYIFLHGLVDTTYFKNDLAIVFWLSIFAIKKEHP